MLTYKQRVTPFVETGEDGLHGWAEEASVVFTPYVIEFYISRVHYDHASHSHEITIRFASFDDYKAWHQDSQVQGEMGKLWGMASLAQPELWELSESLV
jgi:hypothetical protein